MNLLAIIIVFFLMQNWSGARRIQQDDWLVSWNKWAGVQLGRLKIPLEFITILVILLPALAVGLLAYFCHGEWLGFFGLIILLVVLLYSLGRGDFNDLMDRYLEAWRAKNFQSVYEIAQSFSHGEILEKTENLADLQRYSVQALLYQSFERWFAVIFWFVILGPFGAVAYRISFVLANEGGIPDQYCNSIDRKSVV